jgi:hypothetical protein
MRAEIDTFNDKQSQIAERKTGDGRGPGDHGHCTDSLLGAARIAAEPPPPPFLLFPLPRVLR